LIRFYHFFVRFSGIGFQQVSFVNSIATTNGGRHVDHVVDQMFNNLSKFMINKNGDQKEINFQIKNSIWIFVNCLIENPKRLIRK
jgi:DNA topoisomerase II